jgi:hypothetical protein
MVHLISNISMALPSPKLLSQLFVLFLNHILL